MKKIENKYKKIFEKNEKNRKLKYKKNIRIEKK